MIYKAGYQMKKRNLKDYLSIKEASQIIGVSRATLRRWDNQGRLKAIKHPITGFRLYDKKDLDRFLSKLKK
jgi:DNA (cytosine-5)-methyltransferase 1